MQLKIGLPYQIYVNAPRAKFGGLGCRVWAAVGARLLKVGLSVLTPPLERGGNAVLGTGWYRTVCGFECRRYTVGTKLVPCHYCRMLIHMMEEKKLTPQ